MSSVFNSYESNLFIFGQAVKTKRQTESIKLCKCVCVWLRVLISFLLGVRISTRTNIRKSYYQCHGELTLTLKHSNEIHDRMLKLDTRLLS